MPEGMRNYRERFNTEASSGCIKLGGGEYRARFSFHCVPRILWRPLPGAGESPVSVPAAANRGENTGIQVAMGLADSSSNVRISSSCQVFYPHLLPCLEHNCLGDTLYCRTNCLHIC